MKNFLLLFGAGMGVISAGFWFTSAYARVTWKKSIARRKRKAAKKGVTPNLGGVSFGGNDFEATLKLQSTLNGVAALLAGFAILAQTAANFVE
jgi:hypothetical protein